MTILQNFVTIANMIKIRLQRVGRVHEPVFRLVLTDSKNSTKSGKYLENLGSFDSRRGEKAVFNTERVKYWLTKGAQATGTVHNLLISKKVTTGKKINVLPKKKPIVKEGEKSETKTVEAESKAIATELNEVKVEEEVSKEETAVA